MRHSTWTHVALDLTFTSRSSSCLLLLHMKHEFAEICRLLTYNDTLWRRGNYHDVIDEQHRANPDLRVDPPCDWWSRPNVKIIKHRSMVAWRLTFTNTWWFYAPMSICYPLWEWLIHLPIGLAKLKKMEVKYCRYQALIGRMYYCCSVVPGNKNWCVLTENGVQENLMKLNSWPPY